MTQTEKKGLSLYTKISIVANTLLFGITGVIYLTQGGRINNIIGFILLAAGAMNILYTLFTIKTVNMFFVVLNFIFAVVSLIVALDYLTQKGKDIGTIWMIITIYYIITGFILLIQVNRRKIKNKEI